MRGNITQVRGEWSGMVFSICCRWGKETGVYSNTELNAAVIMKYNAAGTVKGGVGTIPPRIHNVRGTSCASR